jgi:hypothetical protein
LPFCCSQVCVYGCKTKCDACSFAKQMCGCAELDGVVPREEHADQLEQYASAVDEADAETDEEEDEQTSDSSSESSEEEQKEQKEQKELETVTAAATSRSGRTIIRKTFFEDATIKIKKRKLTRTRST